MPMATAGGQVRMGGALLSSLFEVADALSESKSLEKQSANQVFALQAAMSDAFQKVRPDRQRDLVRQLDKLTATYRASLGQVYGDFAAGRLSRTEALAEAEKLAGSAFAQARALGYRWGGVERAPAGLEMRQVQGAVGEEMGFFDGFLAQTGADSLRMDPEQRLDLYGQTLEHQFNQGQVAVVPPDAKIHWVLGIAEHCQDCITLAAESPYDPPSSASDHLLPTVPRSGDTRCLSNCRCRLRYELAAGLEYGGATQGGYALTHWRGKELSADEIAASKILGDFQASIDDLGRRLQHERQRIRLLDRDTDEWRQAIQSRRTLNQQLISFLGSNDMRAVPRISVKELTGAVDRMVDEKWTWIRPAAFASLAKGTALGLVEGNTFSLGTVTAVSEAALSLRLVSGKVITVAADDPVLVFLRDADALVAPADQGLVGALSVE